MWAISIWFFYFISAIHGSPPMENPNLFEGDMMLTPDQLKETREGNINNHIPMAATKINLWPRIVPFDYNELRWHGSGRHAIDEAIKAFEKNTCLRFKERTTEEGYLKFYNGGGCFTYVGYTKGERYISLGKGCWKPAIAMHEIMHALGFYHEQSRPDRDNYVKIHYENMFDGAKSQFKKRGRNEIDSLGVKYDYKSVMHYRKKAFTKNNKITIETLDKSMQDVIGQRNSLSTDDVLQINLLYRCNETQTTSAPPTRTSPDLSCVDIYALCYRHKDKCQYPKDNVWYKWVSKECKRTCNLCAKATTQRDEVADDAPVPTTQSSIIPKDACKDLLVNCDQYKADCNGTSTLKSFLKRYCSHTCGYCGVPPTTPTPHCFDLAKCEGYVVRGYCNQNTVVHWYRFMRQNCIKSCGWCNAFTAMPPVGTTPAWPKECGISDIPMSRVVGGNEATPGSWPWIARLYKTNTGRSYCGATLISTTWLVTAAHCVAGKMASEITVSLGAHNLAVKEKSVQRIQARQVITHFGYGKPTRMNNDIALIQLSKPALLNNRVKAACLPRHDKPVAVGTKCYLTGWGKTRHPGIGAKKLQQTDLDIVDNTLCHILNYGNYRVPVTKTMVCAGLGKNTIQSGCHGDSGGPLVCLENGRFVLHGDVSWGSNTCDVKRGYTVFGRISYFRKWMDRYIYT